MIKIIRLSILLCLISCDTYYSEGNKVAYFDKPANLPEWATDAGADIVEPSQGQKEDGWDPDDRPPAGWWNWWSKNVYDWTKQFRAMVARNWTRYTENPTSSDSFFDFAYAHQISGVTKKVWVGVGQRSASTGIWSSRGGNGRWAAKTNPTASGNMNGVVFDEFNGNFITVGQDSGGDANVATSPDGETFTERANPKAFDLNGIAVNPAGIAVAVGQADGTDAYIIRSTNGGLAWAEQANPKNFTLNAVVWSADYNLFFAVGFSDGSDTYCITSPDGQAPWTERSCPDNIAYNAIAAGGGAVVAFASSANCMIWNPGTSQFDSFSFPEISSETIDAAVWSEELKLLVVPFQNDITGGAPDGGMAVALSPDGAEWDIAFLGISGNTTDFTFYGIGAGYDNLVGGGVSGSIAYSLSW